MYNSHLMPGMPDMTFRHTFEDFVQQGLLPMPGHNHDDRSSMLQNRDGLSHQMHMHVVANQHHHHHHLPPVPTFLPPSSSDLPSSPLTAPRHHHLHGHPQSPLLMTSSLSSQSKQSLGSSAGMQIKPEKSNNSTPSPGHGSMIGASNIASKSPLSNQTTPPPSFPPFSPQTHQGSQQPKTPSSPQRPLSTNTIDCGVTPGSNVSLASQTVTSAKGRNSTPRKLHSCTECSESFSQKKSLTSHLARIHGLPENAVPIPRPHVCEVCSKSFTLLTNLKKHSIIHTGIKPYQCIECGRAFSHLVNLKSHARTHSGIKPYQCETCQRQFAVKSNLTKHLAVHSGIKAYACEDCGRRFSFSANLRSHMRIHSGEKPYECADCGHRFTVSSNLKKHTAAMHSGIKPARRRRQAEPRDPLAAILKTEEIDATILQQQLPPPPPPQSLVPDMIDSKVIERIDKGVPDNNRVNPANQGGCDMGIEYDDCDDDEDDDDDYDEDEDDVIEMDLPASDNLGGHHKQ